MSAVGSQAAAASQSVGSRPQSRPRLAANSATATQPSDSATPASDSATVGVAYYVMNDLGMMKWCCWLVLLV